MLMNGEYGNIPSLKEMVTLGVPGFKCFLIHSGVDEFPAVTRDQVKFVKSNHFSQNITQNYVELKNTDWLSRLERRCLS